LLYRPYLENQIDRLADLIERHIDVSSIIRIAEKFRGRLTGSF
jgi:cobyric acid synthase